VAEHYKELTERSKEVAERVKKLTERNKEVAERSKEVTECHVLVKQGDNKRQNGSGMS
jgi:ABC-type Fe3+-citrate transport system substrate-binding protein